MKHRLLVTIDCDEVTTAELRKTLKHTLLNIDLCSGGVLYLQEHALTVTSAPARRPRRPATRQDSSLRRAQVRSRVSQEL